MHFSFESLITPLTATQVKESLYDVLSLIGVDTTSWKPGAVVRTMISATSVGIAACSEWISGMAKAATFETAEEEWIDLHGFYVYGVERETDQFASGNVQVSNSAATPYAYSPGQLVVRNGTTRKTYSNSIAVTIAASAAGQDVAMVADESGADSTAGIGEINEVTSGASSLTVTNSSALVGSDEETDDAYKVRCKLRTGALSPNGPADAYGYVARSATRVNGSAIGVTRVKVIPDGLGNVAVYVATPTGAVTGSISDPASDLGIIYEDILQWATPHGITPTLYSADQAAITVQYDALVYTSVGLDTSELATQIEAAIVSYLSGVPIGGEPATTGPGRVYADTIRTEIRGVNVDIFNVTLNPDNDVLLAATEVPVLAASLGSFTLIPRPASV
jgi:hypothetical protein